MSEGALNILLVEDSDDDAFLLQRLLARTAPGQFDVRAVTSLKAAAEAAAEKDYHVALLDLSLPDSFGIDTFLGLHRAAPGLPVVVLTGNEDERIANQALQEGAQDYLIKGKVDGNSLVRAVRYAIQRERARLLELSNLALQGEVKERKKHQAELQRLAAKLERSNRELQQFASVASHDLQEPLRKITVFGDRLRSKAGGVLDDRSSDYLDRMINAATRMQQLINELLAFARVETRAKPFAPVNLSEVVTEVLHDLEVRVEKSEALVEVGDLPVIDGDDVQLRQLLQNLMANALKFSVEGRQPVVRVDAEQVVGSDGSAPENPEWRLTVADNGIGFDEKYIDRIFAPFQRLHGRNEYEGSGMGLAICSRIVERHGGRLLARSTPGEGATFIATLPSRQTKADGEAAGP